MESFSLDKVDIDKERYRVYKTNRLYDPFDGLRMHDLVQHKKIEKELKHSKKNYKAKRLFCPETRNKQPVIQ